ncbi:MAG: glycosyltransferase family 39 protein [Endomicrobium sp.]|jgi:hypothetical protein|nr:glycosyltransferase family 39 protein [Endomicrobium sp.]
MEHIKPLINKYKFQVLSFSIIFFLTYLIYGHTTNFGFTYSDDNALIVNRLDEMDSIVKAKDFIFKPVFNEEPVKFYRPVLNISLLIDSIISGGESGFYHFSNMVIHIISTFLLLLFLKELGYSDSASFITSILFVVHPAFVSSVAWIPGRNDPLLAIFTFLTFIYFIKNLKTGKILYLLFMVIFFTIALFTKETALVIPLILLIYVFLYENTSIFGRKVIIASIFLIFPVLLYFLMRFYVFSHNGTLDIDTIKVATNIIRASGINIWYFGIIFLIEKIMLYPQIYIHAQYLIKGTIVIMTLVVLCLIFRKKINFKHTLFGTIWYIVFIIPTYVVANNTYHTHRLCLPIVGLFIVLIEIASVVHKAYPRAKNIFYSILLFIAVFMSFSSYKQSFFYKDRENFWLRAQKENPSSPMANIGTAKYYESINDLENAEKYAIQAVQNDPRNKMSSHLASIYLKKGYLKKAKYLYEKALSSNDKYNEYSYIGLGKVYMAYNDMESALKVINKGLSIMPDSQILKKYLRILNNEEEEENKHIIIMKYKSGR